MEERRSLGMGFLVYMVRRGVVTPLQAIDLCDQQLRRRPPIGQLAVQRGLLTPDQVADVVRTQAKDHRRFGEVCMRLGWLNSGDVDALREEQDVSMPQVQSLMISTGIVDPETVEHYWAEYVLSER